jgi:2-keto-4-pentenoate hydratase
VQTPRHVELADALWHAETSRVPIAPLTEQYDDLVVEDAYAVQAINVQRRLDAGARVVGRKVGLTSKPMQQVLGVDEPDYGVLLDDMYVEEGDEIDLARLIQPRIEAEMAFVLDRDLVGPGVTAPRALAAVPGVLPAVEIVDSRVVDWRIRLVDTVADNASCGLLVVGARLTPVAGIDLRLVGMALSRNGEVIDTGAGAAALGNPARCVVWLANRFGTLGSSLAAGDVILPGAVHQMVPVRRGDAFRAEFAHLGAVTATFSV